MGKKGWSVMGNGRSLFKKSHLFFQHSFFLYTFKIQFCHQEDLWEFFDYIEQVAGTAWPSGAESTFNTE